jgi:hypothetical protein
LALRLVAIEKESTFQGHTERWSNVYCYDTAVSTAAEMTGLINAIVAAEQPVHATSVSFKRGRIYTRQGLNGPGDSGVMYHVLELTAVGTAAIVGSLTFYKELAILIKFPLPRKNLGGGALGRQRSLKKWIHPCTSSGIGTGPMDGSQPLSPVPSQYTTYGSAIQVPVAGSQLVSPDGTLPNAAAVVHPYVEHRQFPRGRKET